MQLVIRIVRIADRPDILVTAQDSSRNSRHNPVRRLEGGSRYFFAGSAHFRCALKLPVAAGEVDLAFRRGRSRNRLCHQSTFTHHFHFTQDITAVISRLLHEDTHVAGFLLAAEGDFIVQPVATRQLGNIFPLLGIIRHLYLSFNGFIDPVQDYLVELGRASEIHIQPFFSRSGAHPGAVEEL